MRDEPVFTAAARALAEYFREALVPTPLGDPDAVRLTWPGAQEDFRLGLCLYDVEALREGVGTQEMVRLSREERRYPDLAVALRFLAFANRKAAFHSMEAEDELLLLEGVVRTLHSAPALDWDGGPPLKLWFQWLPLPEKRELWQGMGAPFQPAVYFAAGPVPIPSTRILRVPVVREVEVSARPAERRRP